MLIIKTRICLLVDEIKVRETESNDFVLANEKKRKEDKKKIIISFRRFFFVHEERKKNEVVPTDDPPLTTRYLIHANRLKRLMKPIFFMHKFELATKRCTAKGKYPIATKNHKQKILFFIHRFL